MGGYLSLLRPGNGAVAAAAVLAGGLAAAGPAAVEWPAAGRLLAGCAAAFAFTGAGNALNDYFDRETDKLAHPGRPIPSGRVSAAGARLLAGALFATSLGVAAWLSAEAFAIVASSTVLMVAYEVTFKARGLPGNVTIAYLSGITFAFGGAIVGGAGATLPLAALGMLASLGREVAKDIEDMGADKDRRTYPQRVGSDRAGYLSGASTVLAVALSPLLYLPLRTLGFVYVPLIGLADATFIYAAFLAPSAPRKSQQWSKAGMALATLAFAAGGWWR